MPLPALAVAGGGALLGGIGSMMGQSSQNRANQQVANMLGNAWQPVTTTSGGATASFDPESGFTTGLTGPAAEWQQQLFSGAMAQPSTMGADIFGQGQGMLTQAMGMPGIDVNAMAGEEAQRLQALAQPGQEREAGGLMARLMASGRLGASGGAGMFGELQQAQEMQDLGLASQALTGARQAASLQDQLNQGMFGRGMNLMGFGQDVQQQDLMNRLALGGAATNLFDLERQAGMFSQGLGDRSFAAAQAQAPLMQSQGASPFSALVGGVGQGMLSRGMDSLFG